MAVSIGIYPLGIGSFGATRLWHHTFVLLVDGERTIVDCRSTWMMRLVTIDIRNSSGSTALRG